MRGHVRPDAANLFLHRRHRDHLGLGSRLGGAFGGLEHDKRPDAVVYRLAHQPPVEEFHKGLLDHREVARANKLLGLLVVLRADVYPHVFKFRNLVTLLLRH